MKEKLSFKKIEKNKGFSLIELLMVSAIFFIVLGATLFKQSRFSSDILISNTAYDVALSIREAQVFGVGSREADISDPAQGLAYGVHFDATDLGGYKTFLDGKEANLDFSYDATEEIEAVSLTREQKVKTYAVYDGEGNWTELPGSLDIVFKKPDLDARIRVPEAGARNFPEARIMVQSSLGDKCRVVSVTAVGQISVLPICSEADTCSYECLVAAN